MLLSNSFPGAKAFEVKNCLVETAKARPVQPVADSFGIQHKIGGGVLDVDAAYNCLAKLIPTGPDSGALGDCPKKATAFGEVGGIDFVKPILLPRGTGPPMRCFLRAKGKPPEDKKERCINVTSVLQEYRDNCNSDPTLKRSADNLVVFKFTQWQVNKPPNNVSSSTAFEQGPKNVARIDNLELEKGNKLCIQRGGLSARSSKLIHVVVMARDRNGNERFVVPQILLYRATDGRDDCPRNDE